MTRALVCREMAHNSVCCMYITFVLRKTLTVFRPTSEYESSSIAPWLKAQ